MTVDPEIATAVDSFRGRTRVVTWDDGRPPMLVDDALDHDPGMELYVVPLAAGDEGDGWSLGMPVTDYRAIPSLDAARSRPRQADADGRGSADADFETIRDRFEDRVVRLSAEPTDEGEDMTDALAAVLSVADEKGTVTWSDVSDDLTSGQWGRLIETGPLVDADGEGFVLEDPADNPLEDTASTTAHDRAETGGSDTSGTATSAADTDSDDPSETTNAAGAESGDRPEETTSASDTESGDRPEPTRETDAPATVPEPPEVSPPLRADAYDHMEPLHPQERTHHQTTVFRADLDGTPVVVKRPGSTATLTRDDRDAILEEATRWQRFADADHVVTLLNAGRSEDYEPWIVMEYMDGGTLADRLGDLPVAQAVWTGLGMVHGVNSAHRQGVQHRDLKPSNVLFRSVEDAWDVPKVADWGAARAVTDEATTEAITERYAAPEQHLALRPELAADLDLDSDAFAGDATEIDQYQLGLVLYELLTGRHPFGAGDRSRTRAKFEATPTPPSRVDPAVPDAADDVLLRALAPRPRRRHHNLTFFLVELAEVYDAIVARDVDTQGAKYDGWTTDL